MKLNFFFVFQFLICLQAQDIPSSRRVDWTTAGYMRQETTFPISFDTTITVSGFTEFEINKAIKDARTYNAIQGHENHFTKVFLPAGTYTINDNIILINDLYFPTERIFIVGAGSTSDPAVSTILKFDYPIYKDDPVIRIEGRPAPNTPKYQITSYSGKRIILNTASHSIRPGDYIDLLLHNGTWHDENNDILNHGSVLVDHDYVGQLIKVTSVSASRIMLEDDIELIMSLDDSGQAPYIRKVEYVSQNIGISNLRIESDSSNTYINQGISDTTSNRSSLHISINYAANIWINSVASITPGSNHIHISRSTGVEVVNSYFKDAQYWGGGGYGYGVLLMEYSSYCLIENNIFKHLRHSILLQTGAHHNVIGYNYSREQHDLYELDKEDLSLHGHFPFANLFEGNRVDRFGMDLYWGMNGPYNTFLRNYSYYHMMKMEWQREVIDGSYIIEGNNHYNLLGNEAKIYFSSNCNTDVIQIDIPSEVCDRYGLPITDELFLREVLPPYAHHEDWTENYKNNYYLSDVSYYYSTKPSFLNGYQWPPIGPPTSPDGLPPSQDIPARDNWCSWNPGNCEANKDIPIEHEDEINYNFALYQNYPNPFNPTTTIMYSINQNGTVTIKLYDVLGREVKKLVDEIKPAGDYTFTLTAKDLSSGIYFYKLQSGSHIESRKLILLK